MNRKFLTCIFTGALMLTMVACGNKQQGNKAEEKVLEDTERAAWCLHGNFILADGTTQNGWNGKDKALYEASKMTAISIKEARELDAKVGEALASKKVKYLYKYEGAVLGTNDAGWTAKFLDEKKDLYQANGSYVFKATALTYDAEEEVYSEDQWIPDPKVSYAESLDGNVFFPTWSEAYDEDGFSWAENNVLRSGAGVYTIIVAQYDVAVSPTQPNFGVAAIRTAEKEGIAYEKLTKYVPADHTYGIVGLGNVWDSDNYAMVREGETLTWAVDIAVAADTQFKIRADAKWDNSWGYSSVDLKASTDKVSNADGNIGIKAGNYNVKVTFAGPNATIVITEK